jgi:CRISPR-associated protein Csb2
MPTLLISFPARRYHATPWGHHVNEGLIEWPPSPWRILRALLSVGYSALGWPASLEQPWRSSPPAAARRLVESLASVAPRYALPPASGAHSRHYMPMGEFKDGRERTTMVFDTWAQIEHGELAITWDLALDDETLALLSDLASHLNYLGRSESWVHARLAAPHEMDNRGGHVCWPCSEGRPAGAGWEQVALLAPVSPAAYVTWRSSAIRGVLEAMPRDPAGQRQLSAQAAAKREAERSARMAIYPEDMVACLQIDTSFLREYGWSQPPGTEKLLYWRRSDALQYATTAPDVNSARHRAPPVRAVLLAMASASLNNHALPTLARTLPQAEMLHRQALGAFGRLGPLHHSPVLSGCGADGKPLRGAHGHAHLLPIDLDEDHHLDHVLVWAPDGLSAQDQAALRLVRSTYTKGGVGALRLAWVGAGELEDLAAMPDPFGPTLRRMVGRGRRWVSATPFVPPRHLKPRGAHTLEGQIAAELASRGLPAPSEVCRLDPHEHDRSRQLRHVARVRRHGPPPPSDQGFTLRLGFDAPVQGPLCLGYGSHFGLGRFECLPADEDPR